MCARSDTVVDGIRLIAFGRHDKPCDTVRGIDVRDGRKVGERDLDGIALYAFDGAVLAAGQGVAVLADQAVHGYALADGAPRWATRPTEPKGGRAPVRTADGTRLGASGGTSVPEAVGQLIRAGDTWVWADSDGGACPPVLALRP
ncbi:hypothetical protein ACFV83_01135 [Streptomyces pharetrae]|uniref:hypothetical protein n=1 Tax=Streptomyces pharetrae TaxID=291370 RepID=UPI00364F94C4